LKEVKKTLLASSCKCTKPQVLLEVNFSFDKEHLQYFNINNFTEVKSYTNVGILYVEDANLAAIGPFGSNRLQIKCKTDNCDASLANLENVLRNFP
jgi:hypothetical protein